MNDRLEQLTKQERLYLKVGRIIVVGTCLYFLTVGIIIMFIFVPFTIISDAQLLDFGTKLSNIKLYAVLYALAFTIPSWLGIRWILSKEEKVSPKDDTPEPDSTEKPL